MSDNIEIKPSGKTPTLLRIWTPALITFFIFAVYGLLRQKPFMVAVLAEALVVLLVSLDKHVLLISVSLQDKTLEYYYLNSLGQERKKTIDLPSAEGTYKREKITSYSYDWRLRIKNGKRPYNKIVLTVNKSKGFSKAQLDEIAALIDQCKQ